MALGMPGQPDPLSYVFKIPTGIKFHDVDPVYGREFTAEDIKYSIERQMTDRAGVFQARLLLPQQGEHDRSG